MKAELTDITICKKALDIEIPLDTVDGEINKIAGEYARKARVPGVRPGKAPVPVVKSRFREEIADEMMHHLLPRYFRDAVVERKLEIADGPHFERVEHAGGKPLTFRAVFEIYPQMDVSNYKGIPAEQVQITIEDSEIESTLKQLQEDNSELVTIDEDRVAKEGDFVEMSFQPISDPDAALPPAERAVVELGGQSTLKEFTENLSGIRVGEERTFVVEYRADYPSKPLAGKAVTYKVKAETLKEKRRPELTDEFAQGLGQFKTMEEFRTQIREDLEKHKLENANEQVREKLLEWLEDHNEFEVPESMVERQIQVRMQRLVRDLSRQGLNPQHLDVDWSKIREDQRKQSVRDVKGSLLLDHIAVKENVEVADEEVEAEIVRIASETNRPAEKVREVLGRDSGMERLREQLRSKKTLDFLQQHSQIQPIVSQIQS
jgi:trigger factor